MKSLAINAAVLYNFGLAIYSSTVKHPLTLGQTLYDGLCVQKMQ